MLTLTLEWRLLWRLLEEAKRVADVSQPLATETMDVWRALMLKFYGELGFDMDNRVHVYELLTSFHLLGKAFRAFIQTGVDLEEFTEEELELAVKVFLTARDLELNQLVPFIPVEVMRGLVESEQVEVDLAAIANFDYMALAASIRQLIDSFPPSPSQVASYDQLEAELLDVRRSGQTLVVYLRSWSLLIAIRCLHARLPEIIQENGLEDELAQLPSLFLRLYLYLVRATLAPELREMLNW